MTTTTAPPIDLSGVYTLISGLNVLPRGESAIQIGSEPPHWLILHDAPVGSAEILRRLDGTVTARQVLHTAGADPAVWSVLLKRLLDLGLLIEVTDWSFPGAAPGPFLEAERDGLVHRHGTATARRALQARADAVVVVRGTGRVATAVSTTLAASGVGHVHQQPDRALRMADLPPPEPFAAAAEPARRSHLHGAVPVTGGIGRPTRGDAATLAANLRRAAPHIKVHAPAAHHRVALVVLAGDGPPSPSLAAELTARGIAHLAVRAGLRTAAVGPFVLPGRSSCLICALRQRSEIDAGRAVFEDALRMQLIVPSAQLVCFAAALAVADVLEHLDGVGQPATLDGTIEWTSGDPGPRRRTWTVHPDCGCTDLRVEGSAAGSSADRRP